MKIEIDDLQATVKLGCTAEERAYPQVVVFQLELSLADNKSLESDDLDDTIDYMRVLATVQSICETKEYALLEHLSSEVGKGILELSEVIGGVSVSVQKRISPLTSGISFSAEFSR